MSKIDTELTMQEYSEKIAHIGYTPKDTIIRSVLLTQDGIDAGWTRGNCKELLDDIDTVKDALEILAKNPTPDNVEPPIPEQPEVEPTPPISDENFVVMCDISKTTLKLNEFVQIPPIKTVCNFEPGQICTFALIPENCVMKGFTSKPDKEYTGSYGMTAQTDYDAINNEITSVKLKATSTDNVKIKFGYTPNVIGDYTIIGELVFRVE